MSIKNEIFRKSIHLSSLTYPALYSFWLEKSEMLYLTGAIATLLLLIDFSRKKYTKFRQFFNSLFTKISRKSEIDGKFYGSTYFMIGTFLTIFLFAKTIAIASLLVLIISDTCASIFGKAISGRKLFQEKSLAGFLAFFISAFIISIFVNIWFVISAFFASLIELYAKKIKIDDNLLIPICYGILSTIINLLL